MDNARQPQKKNVGQTKTVCVSMVVAIIGIAAFAAVYVALIKPANNDASSNATVNVNSTNAQQPTSSPVVVNSSAHSASSANQDSMPADSASNENKTSLQANSASAVPTNTVNAQAYVNKKCETDADCGVFPCVDGICMIKECTCSCSCHNSTCGGPESPAPGYCISAHAVNST